MSQILTLELSDQIFTVIQHLNLKPRRLKSRLYQQSPPTRTKAPSAQVTVLPNRFDGRWCIK
ncbi:hypothetical protein [Coleofasciculus sp.]|uniref:hypothetical protein n=1 Tax=Coleofasciculus sp. TaxID=3100458 RepID=UPI003A1DB80D